MKRSAFKPKGFTPRPAKQVEYTPRARAVAVAANDTSARMVVQVPKENALQHKGYMDVVRRMACMHCGRAAPSQFCHADEGKGERIKTDCRRGWPGCADGPGRLGCHSLIGSTGSLKREHKRLLEANYGRATRADVIARGLWPADLPRWPEDESTTSREAATTEGD